MEDRWSSSFFSYTRTARSDTIEVNAFTIRLMEVTVISCFTMCLFVTPRSRHHRISLYSFSKRRLLVSIFSRVSSSNASASFSLSRNPVSFFSLRCNSTSFFSSHDSTSLFSLLTGSSTSIRGQ